MKAQCQIFNIDHNIVNFNDIYQLLGDEQICVLDHGWAADRQAEFLNTIE